MKIFEFNIDIPSISLTTSLTLSKTIKYYYLTNNEGGYRENILISNIDKQIKR